MPIQQTFGHLSGPQAKAFLGRITGLGVSRIQEKLGQVYSTDYGTEPEKMSDWDKFMQFNNAVAPVIGQILGTWIQGRYQAQSAQQMAQAMESMTPQERSYIMQAYMTQQMLRQQGYQTQYSPQMMTNMGQAFNMLPYNMKQSTANDAMSQLMASAGGNAQIQGMISQQGAQFGATGGVSLTILIPVAIAAGGLILYLALRRK